MVRLTVADLQTTDHFRVIPGRSIYLVRLIQNRDHTQTEMLVEIIAGAANVGAGTIPARLPNNMAVEVINA